MSTVALHYALEQKAVEYLRENVDFPGISFFVAEGAEEIESPCVIVSAIETGQDEEVCGVWHVELTAELVATPEELSVAEFSRAFRQISSALGYVDAVKAALTGSDSHVFSVNFGVEVESEIEDDVMRRALTVELMAVHVDDANTTLPTVEMPARAILSVSTGTQYWTDNFSADYDPESLPTAPGGAGVPGTPINGDVVTEQRRNAVVIWSRTAGAWVIKQAQNRPQIYAEDYGLSTAGTGAANKTALEAAIAAAVAVDIPLVLPSGTFAMTNGIAIGDNLIMSGKGRKLTILDFTAAGDFAGGAFEFSAFGIDVEISDMKLLGLQFSTQPVNEPKAFDLLSNAVDDGAAKYSLTLDGVESQYFHYACYGASGKHGIDLTLRNCWFHQMWESAIVMFSDDSTTYVERTVKAYDCTFENNLTTTPNEGLLNYLHPHVAKIFDNCEFGGAVSFALEIRATTSSNNASYSLVEGCFFRSDNTRFIASGGTVADNPAETHPPLIIRGCRFDVAGGDLQLWHGCILTGNEFHITETTGNLIQIGDLAGEFYKESVITGNAFSIESQTGNHALIAATADRHLFSITGNTFDYFAGATVAKAILIGSTVGTTDAELSQIEIKGNMFRHQGTTACRFIEMQGDCLATVEGNSFRGRSESSRGLIVPKAPGTPNANTRLTIRGNTFDTLPAAGASTAIWIGEDAGDGNTDDKVFISDNTVIGSFSNIDNNGSYQWHFLPARGTNPTAITAAASIILNPNFDVHEITGTTQIDTINFGPVVGTGAAKIYSGTITLILPTGGNVGTGGNISKVFSASGTQALALHYSKVSSKWTIL